MLQSSCMQLVWNSSIPNPIIIADAALSFFPFSHLSFFSFLFLFSFSLFAFLSFIYFVCSFFSPFFPFHLFFGNFSHFFFLLTLSLLLISSLLHAIFPSIWFIHCVCACVCVCNILSFYHSDPFFQSSLLFYIRLFRIGWGYEQWLT